MACNNVNIRSSTPVPKSDPPCLSPALSRLLPFQVLHSVHSLPSIPQRVRPASLQSRQYLGFSAAAGLRMVEELPAHLWAHTSEKENKEKEEKEEEEEDPSPQQRDTLEAGGAAAAGGGGAAAGGGMPS
ncbi:unnamed protein product [Merluccius merluccius]